MLDFHHIHSHAIGHSQTSAIAEQQNKHSQQQQYGKQWQQYEAAPTSVEPIMKGGMAARAAQAAKVCLWPRVRAMAAWLVAPMSVAAG